MSAPDYPHKLLHQGRWYVPVSEIEALDAALDVRDRWLRILIVALVALNVGQAVLITIMVVS